MNIVIVMATVTGSVLLSCHGSNELSESERVRVVEEVTATLQRYYEDIKESGLMAELNYLDKSQDFFWVPPEYSSALSYDSVVAILKQNAPTISIADNSFDTLTVTPLSRELALYTGRLRSVIVDTSGVRNEFVLMETGVMIKRRDGWRLLSGQTGMLDAGDRHE